MMSKKNCSEDKRENNREDSVKNYIDDREVIWNYVCHCQTRWLGCTLLYKYTFDWLCNAIVISQNNTAAPTTAKNMTF